MRAPAGPLSDEIAGRCPLERRRLDPAASTPATALRRRRSRETRTPLLSPDKVPSASETPSEQSRTLLHPPRPASRQRRRDGSACGAPRGALASDQAAPPRAGSHAAPASPMPPMSARPGSPISRPGEPTRPRARSPDSRARWACASLSLRSCRATRGSSVANRQRPNGRLHSGSADRPRASVSCATSTIRRPPGYSPSPAFRSPSGGKGTTQPRRYDVEA